LRRASVLWLILMRSRKPPPSRARITIVLILLGTLAACTHPPAPENGPAAAAPSFGASSLSTKRRDLSQDEAAGGHTLRKHVARTDAELRQRLRHERNISAASTWNDRESAETAVGAALAQQNNKIARWLERDSHPNLVLDYDGNSARPFGRTLRRGEDQVEPCAHAVIVLKWDGGNSYHVLTAYPECRP